MRYVVVGYGNLGRKRERSLGQRCIATVDPAAPGARYRTIDEVDRESYDAAVLAVPEAEKLGYLTRLLAQGTSVLVEKPLLLADRDEGERLLAAAAGRAVWRTAYNFRQEPTIRLASEIVRDGGIGALERWSFLYGNGAVRDWKGTWRELGSGVLEDLACHLIDFAPVLGVNDDEFTLWDARSIESSTFDYAMFSTADRRARFEVGNVFWKNVFAIDIHGMEGSLHLRGLGKWGESTLTRYRRVYPSGVPERSVETIPAGDRTWDLDVAAFERSVARGENSLESDLRISQALASLTRQARSRPAARREAGTTVGESEPA